MRSTLNSFVVFDWLKLCGQNSIYCDVSHEGTIFIQYPLAIILSSGLTPQNGRRAQDRPVACERFCCRRATKTSGQPSVRNKPLKDQARPLGDRPGRQQQQKKVVASVDPLGQKIKGAEKPGGRTATALFGAPCAMIKRRAGG